MTRGPRKHQRRIRISVVLPASVELLVGTDDEDPGEDSDWEILSAHDPRCEISEVSVRLVEENMRNTDFVALASMAARTRDEP